MYLTCLPACLPTRHPCDGNRTLRKKLSFENSSTYILQVRNVTSEALIGTLIETLMIKMTVLRDHDFGT